MPGERGNPQIPCFVVVRHKAGDRGKGHLQPKGPVQAFEIRPADPRGTYYARPAGVVVFGETRAHEVREALDRLVEKWADEDRAEDLAEKDRARLFEEETARANPSPRIDRRPAPVRASPSNRPGPRPHPAPRAGGS